MDLTGSPLVVDYAPQLDLIRRAALVITHAGMNTAMETLSQGVPLVAIPVTNDQPGVAARVKWTGTGEMVPLSKLDTARLTAATVRVFGDESYRNAAERIQRAIHAAGGPTRAAEICEQAIATREPVTAEIR